MKKTFLIIILQLTCGIAMFSQIITFDDQGYSNLTQLSNPYSIVNNGETFKFTISGGVSTNHYYRTDYNATESCEYTGMSHIYAGNTAQTTWTIETTSGHEVDLGNIKFVNVFECFDGFTYELNIEGFKNNVSTGIQLFSVTDVNSIFSSNANFNDVDKIVISNENLSNLGIDDINWSLNPVPVELLSFTSKAEKDGTYLNWVTASELNNDKFQIEASENGKDFYQIGELEGHGTTTAVQEYSYKIDDIGSGIHYFRLKQIDFDGQYEYSKVISLNVQNRSEIGGIIYPNPSSSGVVNMNYTATSDKKMKISILNIAGVLTKQFTVHMIKGDNNLSFNLSDLKNGVYLLKMGEGEEVIHRKIVLAK